jgi:hypothetical protein
MKMMTRPIMVLAGAWLCAGLFAQVPATDARNTNLRHTDFHFSMPAYATLPEWEAHKAHLRRQILVAAGLYPLPERTPLYPEISGRIERHGYLIERSCSRFNHAGLSAWRQHAEARAG